MTSRSRNRPPALSLPDVPDWSHSQKLAFEKEVFGFYLTSHPLAENAEQIRRYATHSVKELAGVDEKAEILLGGMVSSIKKASTKKPSRNGHSRYVNFDFETPEGRRPLHHVARRLREIRRVRESRMQSAMSADGSIAAAASRT